MVVGCSAGFFAAFLAAGFAAVSGASVATAAVFARIAIPEMLKIGYRKGDSAPIAFIELVDRTVEEDSSEEKKTA